MLYCYYLRSLLVELLILCCLLKSEGSFSTDDGAAWDDATQGKNLSILFD